jgi:hypothetical protein
MTGTSLLTLGLAAALLFGSCGRTGVAPVLPCPDPAPLLGVHSPAAPGYVVVFHEGLDPQPLSWHLATKYQFSPISVFDLGFYAEFPDETLAAVRCEQVVRYVEHMVPAAPLPVGVSTGDRR